MLVGPADIDDAGVALVSTNSFDTDRGLKGSMFNPATLACGNLVHVHQLADHRFLLAYSTIWNTATVSGSGYGAHSVKTQPTFFLVTPNGGDLLPVTDRGGTPGEMNSTSVAPSTLRLAGGVSIGSKVYYLRTSATVNLMTVFETLDGRIAYQSSTVLPDTVVGADTITWNKGITFFGDRLIVFGSRVSDQVLFMLSLPIIASGEYYNWLYAGAKGWSTNVADLTPLLDDTGATISSRGTITTLRTRTSLFLSTSFAVLDAVIGRVWTTQFSPFTPWKVKLDNVSLGNISDGTWLGAGIQLQQSLNGNPINPTIVASNVFAGIPWCKTVGSAALLTTSWGLLPVSRLGT